VTSGCPAPDLLLAVDEDVLPAEIAVAVRGHLAICATCAQLKADLAQPPFGEASPAELARIRGTVLTAAGARRTAWWYPVAGLVAAGLALGIYWWPPSRGETAPLTTAALPSAYRLPLAVAPLRLPFASAVVLRGREQGGSEVYLAALGSALEPYRQGRYAEAIQALRALGVRYPKMPEPPFYEGVAHLMRGEAGSAAAPLERARAIGGEALNDDIAWYLAIVRERAGKWNEARILLEPLCGTDGAYQAAACVALKP
jgi:hypothetical protein